MTEENTSYIKCRKCGSPAYKIYNPEEIEKQYPDNKQMQLKMKRQYQCSKQSCSYVFEVSLIEVTKAFMSMRKEEGKTGKDTLDELREKKKEIQGNV